MKFKHLLAAAMSLSLLTASAQTAPKYIFFYVGDGMGLNPVNTTNSYLRDVRHSDTPLLMSQFPVASFCTTYSANSPITDSAAAGTALATGHKTGNGMIGVTPDTANVVSISCQLKERGYGVGIVTSVGLDDATPAAHYGHVPTRRMTYEIACQGAETGFEFMGGAGLMGMTDANGDTTDVRQRYAANGVQMVYGLDGIAKINADKVVLLNTLGSNNNDIGFTIDSIADNLTLPVMAQACLDQLKRTSPQAFFMMCEGGNIDHALHGNDGGAAIKEIINFNQALAVAYEFYLQHPDETLIVVTADHDTGGSVNSQVRDLGVYDYQKVSKDEFNAYCKSMLRSRRVYRWEDFREYLEANIGLFSHIEVSAEDEAQLKARFSEVFEQRTSADEKTLYVDYNPLVVSVFKLLNDAAGVAFTTTNHSAGAVPVFAVGVGSDRFKGMTTNTDLPTIIRQLTGIE